MISSEVRKVVMAVALVWSLPSSAAVAVQRERHSPTKAEVVAMITRIHAASTLPPDATAMAQSLLVEQRYQEAGDIYAALLDKRPKDSGVLYGLALAEFNSGQPAAAETHARKAADLLTTHARPN